MYSETHLFPLLVRGRESPYINSSIFSQGLGVRQRNSLFCVTYTHCSASARDQSVLCHLYSLHCIGQGTVCSVSPILTAVHRSGNSLSCVTYIYTQCNALKFSYTNSFPRFSISIQFYHCEGQNLS